MPLATKTFDQLLDFTRTSSATFVGSNGLIQSTAASQNLMLQTQQFDNAAWTKINSSVTANSTVAPDGTSTADKLVEDTANTGHETRQLVTVAAGPYTYSVYLKAGERSFAMLFVNNGNVGTVFDLSNGTTAGNAGFTAPTAASITSVGDGWYRCSITLSATAASSSFRVFIMQNSTTYSYTGDGTSGVFVWGAQLEAASAATTYTRNNGGVFPPRFDYNPVTLAPKGLLIEEQRTNLLLQSETIDNASWAKGSGTVTANAIASPDGTVDADAFIENTAASAFHFIAQSVAKAASNIQYAVSFYVKDKGRQVGFSFNSGASGVAGRVNPATGIVTTAIGAFGTGWTPGSLTMTGVGNGWYRVVIVATSDTLTTVQFQISLNNGTSATYTGDGVSGAYLWGVQLEAGAFATSYIPTVASQVTRTNDLTSIVAPNFAPWFNPSEGTFVAEFDVLSVANTKQHNIVALYTTGTNDMRIWLWEGQPTIVRWSATNGTTQADINSSAVTANTVIKSAAAYKSNDFAASFNGSATVTDTSATVPTGFSLLNIGTYTGPTGTMCGHIRSITYYPTRLTNAQLQALTA